MNKLLLYLLLPVVSFSQREDTLTFKGGNNTTVKLVSMFDSGSPDPGDSLIVLLSGNRKRSLLSQSQLPVSTAQQTALNGKANTSHNHIYADISNPPTIPTNTNQLTNGAGFLLPADITGKANVSHTHIQSDIENLVSNLAAKQATLTSGTNIKTVNGVTLLGSGDLVVSSSAAWGAVTGTLSNQTDLQSALNLKAPLASPTFTGTVSGVTASMVGLGNVTNESKATMFTSPTFTGTPTGIGIPVYARVTGSNVTTTGQALVDITGLQVTLATNAVYEFDVVISSSTSAVTTGVRYGIQYSAAGATIEGQIQGSLTSTASKAERISALNTATTSFLTTSAQTGVIRITGFVTTGANSGNITVRHLKVTSGTSTVFINSYLKVTRIL